MSTITKIVLPTRPQPDTIVAIFLLRTFGMQQYPGIDTATIEIKHSLTAEETFDYLLAQGILALDVGGGPFDHHGKDACATELVAKHLNIQNDKSIARMVQYARRDDKEGKGTLSTDPIDRAFGLSGLIASLNKSYKNDSQKVVEQTLPLLHAHYIAAREHHIELPKEIQEKKLQGEYFETHVEQQNKRLKIGFVISDKPSMPTYLRSQQGPRLDVVVQKSIHTNHVAILTRQERHIDLSKIAALIRLRETQLMGSEVTNEQKYLSQTGRIQEVEHWYYDPATNSLLNGGPHNLAVTPSFIPWEELQKIVSAGLNLGGQSQKTDNTTNSSYYFSIPIPEESATQLLSNLAAGENVKKHAAKNVHITVEYLGVKTKEEIQAITTKTLDALRTMQSFNLQLSSSQLQFGTPEGYSNAWFLHLDSGSGSEYIHSLRDILLPALNLAKREKKLHVTLATKRFSEVPDDAVAFIEPVEVNIPVTEVHLIETTQENGKRQYKTHTIYKLDKIS